MICISHSITFIKIIDFIKQFIYYYNILFQSIILNNNRLK
nr:MAG TPA: hypothetical protein [Caudoviricetes sp.]